MERKVILSVQNPVVKALVRLREGRERREQGRFLVEGQREIDRAWAAKWPLEALYTCRGRYSDPAGAESLVRVVEAEGVPVVELGPQAFEKVAYRENPDGLLAVALAQPRILEELRLPAEPLVLVVEGVEKPGNLGALLRTADAAGVDALIACDPGTDMTNPNVLRASQGAFFKVPVVVAETEVVLPWLQRQGLRVWATTPAAETELWQADLRGPTALVLGAEDTGLSPQWLEQAEKLRLPMRGLGDSLNVSVTAGICLFEALRQRR